MFPNGEWDPARRRCRRSRALRGRRAELLRRSATSSRSLRLSVELGLLALALTPVIITGGIDLSVGSMMGLAAVVFGAACRDWRPAARRSGAVRRSCVGARRRRAQRAADRAARHPAAHRHARIVLAVSRHRRGHHAGGGQLHRLSRRLSRARPGLSLGRHSGAAAALRAGRSPATSSCCTARSSAARSTRSASRRPARATPAFRSRGASGSSTCSRASSPASPRSSTSRTSARRVRRRHRLRARRDHGRRARRHVGLRRPRHAVGHAARAVRDRRSCRTACSSPRCRRS